MKDETITFNGKQVSFTELPDQLQKVLKDDNSNGIPDSMEPLAQNLGISNLKAEIKAQSQRLEQDEFTEKPKVVVMTSPDIESSAGKILKDYFVSAKYYLAASAFIAAIMYAMLYILGSVN